MIIVWEWPELRHCVILVFEAYYDEAEDRKLPDGYKNVELPIINKKVFLK